MENGEKVAIVGVTLLAGCALAALLAEEARRRDAEERVRGTEMLVSLIAARASQPVYRRERTAETVGGITGFLAGAAGGAAVGSGIGIAAGPLGAIAGTIPGAIIGGITGFLGGNKIGNEIDSQW